MSSTKIVSGCSTTSWLNALRLLPKTLIKKAIQTRIFIVGSHWLISQIFSKPNVELQTVHQNSALDEIE
jgi:hypothetical protein